MIAAALHLREQDEITQVDACPPWVDDGDTELFTIPDNSSRRRAQLSCNKPRLTHAQALYAVLWQGADARELARYL